MQRYCASPPLLLCFLCFWHFLAGGSWNSPGHSHFPRLFVFSPSIFPCPVLLPLPPPLRDVRTFVSTVAVDRGRELHCRQGSGRFKENYWCKGPASPFPSPSHPRITERVLLLRILTKTNSYPLSQVSLSFKGWQGQDKEKNSVRNEPYLPSKKKKVGKKKERDFIYCLVKETRKVRIGRG